MRATRVAIPSPPGAWGSCRGWALIVATITQLLSWFAVTTIRPSYYHQNCSDLLSPDSPTIRILTGTATINAELADAGLQTNKFPEISAFQSTKNGTQNGLRERKKRPKALIYWGLGGSGEIRTHGPLRVDGFQDRCNRPLCHASLG